MSWQEGEGGRRERFIQEIAVEVVTAAEISYCERRVRGFEWRVWRKAQLEEDARNRRLQVEREERERQQQLQQARIDPLLDEGAMDIRAYDAVKNIAASETISISSDAIERVELGPCGSRPHRSVRNARFLDTFEAKGDAK